MIRLIVTENKKHLKVSEWSLNAEKKEMFRFFKKKSRDSNFGDPDVFDKFISQDGLIPIGLWKELKNFTDITGIETDVDGLEKHLNLNFSKDDYSNFIDALFEGVKTDSGDDFYPRDYQLEGGYRALKYKFCCEELATSAGKTSIFYTFNSFLKYKGIINKDNKALLVVPKASLVNQTAKAFKEFNNGLVNWNIHTVGGAKNKFDIDKFNECDMFITTYQSMLNLVPKCIENRIENLMMKNIKKGEEEKRSLDINDTKKKLLESKLLDICSKVAVVNIDEAHTSRSRSITDIINSCKNSKYKLGLSGTLKIDLEYSDFWKMQENMGPLVMVLPASFLIEKGYSPNIKIKQVYLEYDKSNPAVKEYLRIQSDKDLRKKIKDQFRSPKDFGTRMLQIEKSIIFDSDERLNLISDLVKKLGKNTLVLFSDIKNEYGLRASKKLQEWNDNTFYVDGSVKITDRDKFTEVLEKNDDVIIVASYQTFSVGLDLRNVHHIIFMESTKAEITIRQAIGRGMRNLKGKHVVVIWDIIDALKGYSVKHSETRFIIYNDQKFEILKPVYHKLK